MKKVLVLIPARFNSSRFPGKPLALIAGKSMIQRVYDNCMKANPPEGNLNFEVFVVTDSPEIESHLKGNVCRIDTPVNTGSERVFLAFKKFFEHGRYDLVVNFQGDEPLLTGEELRRLCLFHLENKGDIATLIRERDSLDQDFYNRNVVKVIYSKSTGICHYFSRAQIPSFMDDKIAPKWYQHIGVYSYDVQALKRFSGSSMGFYERCESLEQLRALEIGLKILGLETDLELIGVDTPSDIEKVERVLTNG